MPETETEAEYVRLTDLTKLRIVRTILIDVMDSSFPKRNEVLRLIYDEIRKLEGSDDV